MFSVLQQYSVLLKLALQEILLFATTWTNWEGIMLSEISQTEKDKYCMVSLICGIKKKKKVKLIETESRMVVARGEEAGEMGRGW